MNITSVSARNFKGSDFSHKAAPVTVITGKNATGKSAYLQAIQLALTGYLPHLDKTSQGVWHGLAGNPDQPGAMAVALATDAGFEFELKWVCDSKGAVKKEGAVPTSLALPAILCDPSVFFGMSGADRIKTIFDATPGVKINTDSFIEELGKITASPSSVRDELVNGIAGSAAAAFAQKGVTPQAASEQVLGMLRESLKQANSEAKRLSGAFGAAKLPSIIPKDWSEEIKALRQRRDEVLHNLSKLDSLQQEWTGLKHQIIDDPAKEREKWVEAIMRLEKEVAVAANSVPPTAGKVEDFDADLKDIHAREVALNNQITQRSAASEALMKEIAGLEKGKCETCGAERKNPKRLKAAKAELTKLGKEVRALCASLELVAKDSEKLSRRVDAANERASKVQDEVRQIENKRRDAERDLQAAKTFLKDVEGLIAKQAGIRIRMKEIESESAQLQSLKQDKFSIEEQIKEKEKLQIGHHDYVKAKETRDALEVQMLAANCGQAVFTAAGKALNAIVAKTTEEAFNKVLKTAHRFTDGLLKSRMEFRDGDLGRRVAVEDLISGRVGVAEGSWIPHTAFSGMEQMVAYCAFAVALANHAPFKIVFLDELGKMNRETKFKVVARMRSLVDDGVIHQFIGADAQPEDWADCDDATIIKVA